MSVRLYGNARITIKAKHLGWCRFVAHKNVFEGAKKQRCVWYIIQQEQNVMHAF